MKIFILLLVTCLTYAAAPIRIGSKAFSESVILGEMLAIILEENFNQKVERKLNLGGTKVAFDALQTNGIDVYPEYTGTGYVMILKQSGESNPVKIYQIIQQEFNKRFSIKWSKPLGFNNTYALAVRSSDERFKNIKKISDLVGEEFQFRLVAPYEFMERKDGFSEFVRAYGLNFDKGKTVSMNAGLMYSALKNNQADMLMGYGTDGKIKYFNLRTLVDDKGFFPPYQAAFVTRLNAPTTLINAIKLLEGVIAEKEMIAMNEQVDQYKKPASQVARNFLIEKGIVEGEANREQASSNFFQFLVKKKSYLFKLILEHLELSFLTLLISLLVAIPTGILASRYVIVEKIVFPFVNTMQTIPSLALLGFLIPIMGIGTLPALVALFLYSLLPIVRNTFAGISGVEKSFVEAARGMGLTSNQILWHVELPLALPVIIAGVRTAAVIIIGTATLAALIGAGGLGDPIFRGVSTVNSNLILLGAIPSAALALIVDKTLAFLEIRVVSKDLRN